MSLYRRLKGHAVFQPEKLAISFEGESITYRALKERVDLITTFFRQQGLKPGDRVAFLAMNHPDMFVMVFAAARCGLILVPLNWRLSVDELRYVMDDCQASLLIHDNNFSETAKQLCSVNSGKDTPGVMLLALQTLPVAAPKTSSIESTLKDLNVNGSQEQPEPDALEFTEDEQSLTRPLLIVYTSGTTGRPKGAVLNQQALLCSAEMSRHMLDLVSTDKILNVLPLFHVGGLNIQPLPALLYGATLYLHARFDPVQSAKSLCEDGITYINCVPTVLSAILNTEQWLLGDKSSIRAISIGSTDVPVELINRVHDSGIPLIQVYGATETSPVAIYQRVEQAHQVGTIGKAGLLCDIELRDSNNQVVSQGDSGEIHVRGDNILMSYWNNPEATNDSMDRGWFKTGDVAHEDENGFYWFDDRVKHVIISGGENIYPAELERVIRVVAVGRGSSRGG